MITGKTSKLQNSDQGMFLGNCPPTPLPPQPNILPKVRSTGKCEC